MPSYLKIRGRNEAGRKPLRPLPLVVRPRPGKPAEGLLCWGRLVFPCALGRGGIKAVKREGDGATPLARMRLLYGWYRGERVGQRRSRLPLKRITMEDGWCDAPGDRNYNRPR